MQKNYQKYLEKKIFYKKLLWELHNHIKSEADCDVKHDIGHSNLCCLKAVNTEGSESCFIWY